ncbi:diguanylate cyclase domain-containing protein [Neobacillus sp. PS2-9]|uniref:diguanylate cyclase domain-containing protein n=1 Tax=Neobacillus sp. PS2-9 TaxID=3070676 RepID=UPI0027E20AA8|nr:diguanylate cyclase [Neobacillus sp. PS2-9]WML58583.1 diguanylate cyclase [Neobacillus sp. PS2-9]
MNLKLRTYMAVLFAIGINALAAILSLTIGHQASEKIEKEIGNTLSATAYQMADKLDFFMWSRSGEIDVVSQLKDIQEPNDKEKVQQLLDQLQVSFPTFSWVGLTDANGKVVASTKGILENVDISERPVFQNGSKGQFIGDVHDAVLLAKLLPNPSGEPLQFVDISRPVHGEDGKLVGVLAAHLSWEWSHQVEQEILKPLKEKNKAAEIFVISQKDQVILLGPKSMIGKRLNIDSIKQAQKGQSSWQLETWPDGKKYLTGYALGDGYQNYPGLGWSILVRIPEETAFAPVDELQKTIFITGILLALVFAILGWFIAGYITKPLQSITDSANRLRAGEKVEIPHYRGIKDIEILSLSLRDLVDSLVRTVSDLGKMENLAHHDKLTGLMNRIALDSYIPKALERTRPLGEKLTFLFLDLDGFKKVNDTFGHQVGDLLLQEAARRLQGCVRSEGEVFRLGGDEFLIVLFTEATDPISDASIVATKVIESLNQPFDLVNEKIKVGCSVGAAVWEDESKAPIEIIRCADEALYVSKRTGKNKLTFHKGDSPPAL